MISVAMTTYNGEKYIREQLVSIIEQTMSVDEIIICDDRSTDETEKIIREINCSKIRFVKNDKNLGYIENFYKAISLTHGDYIFLADQDDIWDRSKVETIVNLMNKEHCVAMCSNFELIDSTGNLISDMANYQINPFLRKNKKDYAIFSTLRLSFGNVVQGCTYCFNRQVKEVYLSLKNNEVIHDYQIMLIGSCVGRVGFLNRPLIKYRIHSNNSVGFKTSNRKISIPNKISKEPFMARFFRELNELTPIKYYHFYRILYYLRIPFLCAVLNRVLYAQ